jgi:hypothetical protein
MGATMDERTLIAIMAAILANGEDALSLQNRRRVIEESVELATELLSEVESHVKVGEQF